MIATLPIHDSNLSVAWGKAFLRLMASTGGQCHPALITVENTDLSASIEDTDIRQMLDAELRAQGESTCETVAGTIFPLSMWNSSSNSDAKELFDRYKKAWPRIAMCRANRNGVYFRRLTSYRPLDSSGDPINQLEFIAQTYAKGNHRKSALQAAILDPTRDHTDHRQKGFPCLQQVAFTPLSGGRLSITGYYATQYHFEKAYGNYLGLYRLGIFMAKQLNLTLCQVVCVASLLTLGDVSKTKLRSLESDVRSRLEILNALSSK